MQASRQIYQDRKTEVKSYFDFIDSFVNTSSNNDLNKILKSNLLLMLYNLVESTMTTAIDEIHSHLYSNSVEFDLLRTDLRKSLIKFLKNFVNVDLFVQSVSTISKDVIKFCFSKEKLFSGNVDGRKIREVGDIYGFNYNTTYSSTKNGESLVVIKGRRNDLAHGVFSFTEVGKEYSLTDLENMMKETFSYLEEILSNIDSYLQNKEYFEANRRP